LPSPPQPDGGAHPALSLAGTFHELSNFLFPPPNCLFPFHVFLPARVRFVAFFFFYLRVCFDRRVRPKEGRTPRFFQRKPWFFLTEFFPCSLFLFSLRFLVWVLLVILFAVVLCRFKGDLIISGSSKASSFRAPARPHPLLSLSKKFALSPPALVTIPLPFRFYSFQSVF